MRALLSVYDKTGIVDLARRLSELGVELISSGGTAAAIAEAGLPVTDVADHTGYPAMLGHRVVTLHPKVHGGILADRDDPAHRADLDRFDIPTIDIVVGNLYPFGSDPSIELIDIGGPAMVRAAAKNFAHVAVIVDPGDYDEVLGQLALTGKLTDGVRRRLARKAFAHTAAYDASIVEWFDAEETLPDTLHVSATRAQSLRYGENPHQIGARYTFGDSCWDSAVQHGGKEMSYLNVYDADAAWRTVWSLGDDPAVAIIKHANPCGVAVNAEQAVAYQQAHECDPDAAYGGIVAVNRPLSLAMAEALVPIFTEVVVAPGYEDGALELLLTKKKQLRVLTAVPPKMPELEIRTIEGGLLVQTPDRVSLDRTEWTVSTKREPTAGEWRDLELAWRVAARTTSNTIVLVKDGVAVGIGAGQQKRVDAGKIAAMKADGRAKGGACASDAFFPFRDGLDAAIEAGATAVIQPGGSIRDQEVIDAADEAGLAMVFTGERHFKH
jgi:phosphoribosylaminoimidazolecarboxamide formyltransferase/IMP cyclohydrolase